LIVNIKVGQTKKVNSHPQDVDNLEPAQFQPGQFGNTGIMWAGGAGLVSKDTSSFAEGVSCLFTGVAVGAAVVTISGVPLSGGPAVTFDFTVNVTPADPVGPQDLDHFAPAEEPIS